MTAYRVDNDPSALDKKCMLHYGLLLVLLLVLSTKRMEDFLERTKVRERVRRKKEKRKKGEQRFFLKGWFRNHSHIIWQLAEPCLLSCASYVQTMGALALYLTATLPCGTIVLAELVS